MKQIVIVTKNIMAETELQSKLYKLGYEVFCSSQMLEALLDQQGANYLEIFKRIIISETVSDSDVKKILQMIRSDDVIVWRMDEGEKNDKDIEKWLRLGLQRFLKPNMELKELREEFSKNNEQTNKEVKTNEVNMPANNEVKKGVPDFKAFIRSLSTKEKKLFDCLYEARGELVTRDELSKQIWGVGKSNSTLTHLSQIIQRLKKKMQKSGIASDLLQTRWRQGYALSNKFFEAMDTQIEETII